MPSISLKELYTAHEGFVSDKWSICLSEYDRVFRPRQQEPVSLLEVGIQNGGSLQIWEKYFPAAIRLVGCDINPNCERLSYSSEKINLVIGDINLPETLSRIFSIASCFDIVIDDGSHTSCDIIQTFSNLFPYLNQGGLFIAEDLHCSYWENYQGGLHHPRSSMAFFKTLTDILNVEHWGTALSRIELLQPFGINAALGEAVLAEIHSVEFVNSMCIVTKRSAEENRLGQRQIAGQEERVLPIRHLQGSESSAPSQKGNRFSHSEPSAHCQPVADTASRSALEARLYWHEKRPEGVLDYCESFSSSVDYPANGLPQELAIVVPDTLVSACGLRLDIANAQAAIVLHDLWIVGADGEALWRWSGHEDAFANLAGVAFFREGEDAPYTLFALGDDPQFDLALPEKVLAAIRPGCTLRLDITPFPLICQLPQVFAHIAAMSRPDVAMEPGFPVLTSGLEEIAALLQARLEQKDQQIATLNGQIRTLETARHQANEQLLRAESQLELLKELLLSSDRIEPL